MAGKVSTKDDNQSSGGGGGGSSRKTTTPVAKPQEQQAMIIKCPRCDSQNTKFCYYNNYSLTQPRHFCKTCRRYWTNGGALRNVPIGGGCRKNKKLMMKSSSSSYSSTSKDHSSSRSISCDEFGGLQFFQGIDFQVGGGLINSSSSSSLYNNYNQMNINIPNSFSDINLMNPTTNPPCCNNIINFPFSSSSTQLENENNIGATNYQSNLASSIESLSSINQDLHWKLQQQRLAMLFGQKDSGGFSSSSNQIQRPQPILFHNLEGGGGGGGGSNKEGLGGGDQNSRKEGGGGGGGAATKGGGGNLATEWFFDPTPTSSSGNENVGSWNEIQASWNNLNQFTSLP